MTKKPPRTLWVNVFTDGSVTGDKFTSLKQALDNKCECCNQRTFKYVLEEKGKKK